MIEWIDCTAYDKTWWVTDTDLENELLKYLTEEQLDMAYEVAETLQIYVTRVYVYSDHIDLIWNHNYLDSYIFN